MREGKDKEKKKCKKKAFSNSGRPYKKDNARTPILSHIDLACNTSYRFAASRTVFPRVPPYLAGTVCAFWLTYMIVSLAPI